MKEKKRVNGRGEKRKRIRSSEGEWIPSPQEQTVVSDWNKKRGKLISKFCSNHIINGMMPFTNGFCFEYEK